MSLQGIGGAFGNEIPAECGMTDEKTTVKEMPRPSPICKTESEKEGAAKEKEEQIGKRRACGDLQGIFVSSVLCQVEILISSFNPLFLSESLSSQVKDSSVDLTTTARKALMKA
jgi:hypothetical protein